MADPYRGSFCWRSVTGRSLRVLLRIAVGTFVLAGAAALVVCWRIHSSNASEDRQVFLTQPAPRAHQRILVFSPHCDDEALGVGGFIHHATAAGADVRIVMMTNGDGFEWAAAWKYKQIRVTPQLLRKFALDRQKEAIVADGALGVPRSHIVFLGFPDKGLADLWSGNWSAQDPYYSPLTGCSRNPYATSLHPGQAYTGAAVLADVEDQIRDFHPDIVLAPHPNDDHPDHWATSNFVRAALAELKNAADPSALKAEYRVFVVHHGDWPIPQGIHPSIRLAPPFSLAHTDTLWSQFTLSAGDELAKNLAIRAYHSQMAVMSRFLLSFVRTTECFGILEPAVLQVGKGSAEHPVLIEASPLSDTLIRAAEPRANIESIDAWQKADGVCVRVEVRGLASPRVTYLLHLKTIDHRGLRSTEWQASVHGHAVTLNIPGAHAWISGRWMQVCIPSAVLAARRDWFVSAETRMSDVSIDRAGWREFHVWTGPPASTGASV